MTNPAVQMLFNHPVVQEFGVVLERSGRTVRVRVPQGERHAEVASSCLLLPEVGDRVLVAHAGEETYLLFVLRQQTPDAELVFEHDVSFRVPQGKLRVFAQEGVEFASPSSLALEADRIEGRAQRMKMTFSSLEMTGQAILSHAKRVRVVAEAFDSLAGRIYQRAANFLRRTDEVDRVEAKHIDRRAAELYHVHGENTITTAEHLAKINAGQVQIG